MVFESTSRAGTSSDRPRFAASIRTTTLIASLTVFTSFAGAEGHFQRLHSFDLNKEGAPPTTLVEGVDGSFYGATESRTVYPYTGTIFKMDPDGKLTRLHAFDGTDGDTPQPLVQGADGNLYGSTYNGGDFGWGAIYRMSPGGKFAPLYSFTGADDGENPTRLVQASDGYLYGMSQGGARGTTIFRISMDGAFETLYSLPLRFGVDPIGLVADEQGNLFGATRDFYLRGHASIFEVTRSGQVLLLHSFKGFPKDGDYPTSLLRGADGNLYGTTEIGGRFDGGTVFKMSPSGAITLLHSFGNATRPAGKNPVTLIQISDGSLLGATSNGGTAGLGNVFKIDAGGKFSVVHQFAVHDGGGQGGLIEARDGTIYGTTSVSGKHFFGTAFKLSGVVQASH